MKSLFLIIIHILVAIVVLFCVNKLPKNNSLLIIASALVIEMLVIVFLVMRGSKGFNLRGNKHERIMELIEEQDRSSKLLIRRDIELTRANDKLRQLDMQKSEFISIIAHQMRTPLSAMKWTLSMLLKTELGVLSVDQQSFIQKAEENNDYMIGLVEDMLFADKLESGKSDLSKTSFYLGELIDNVIRDITPRADSKHIKIEFGGCSRFTCNLEADKAKIRSAIQNVVDNAVAYTPDSGTVIIHAEGEGDKILITIRDSGIGIPADLQPYIFNKFYRAPNATRTEANGSGLGLFISKRIIEAHRGDISFDSVEGKGTTFSIYIPKK